MQRIEIQHKELVIFRIIFLHHRPKTCCLGDINVVFLKYFYPNKLYVVNDCQGYDEK